MDRELIRVLVIEDDPAFAKLIATTLSVSKGARFETEKQADLKGSLERLRAGGFDLVLLDLDLPDSKGVDTVRSVIGAAPQVPIVVMTGHDDEKLALEAMRHGAEDYLMKGAVDEATLVRSVRYALRRHRNVVDLRHFAQELMTNVDRFMSIVERARIGAIVTSPDGLVVYHNEAALGLLGRSAPDLRAVPLRVPGRTGEAVHLDAATLAEPQPGRPCVEVQLAETEWDDRPARLHLVYPCHHGLEGDAPTAARPQEDLDPVLVENGSEVVAVVDTDGTYRALSRGADNVLGAAPAVLVGSTVWERLDPRDDGRFRDAFLAALQDGRERTIQHGFLRWDRSSVQVETLLRPRVDPVIGIAKDVVCVSHRHAPPPTAGLREETADPTRLLGTVAEALRARLEPMRTHLRMLRSGEIGSLNSAQVKSVAHAEEDAVRLDALVRDLLDLVRSRTGHLEVASAPVDLAEIAASAAEAFAGVARERNVRFENTCDPGTRILGDARRLHEALSHLITHALHHCPAKGRVDLAVHGDAETATLTLRFDGRPPDHMEALFEPFADAQEGTGLGLFLAKQIVSAHQGQLDARPARDGGLALTVRLPTADRLRATRRT